MVEVVTQNNVRHFIFNYRKLASFTRADGFTTKISVLVPGSTASEDSQDNMPYCSTSVSVKLTLFNPSIDRFRTVVN